MSATTAADLTEQLGVPADRVDVTPLGTDLRPASAERVAPCAAASAWTVLPARAARHGREPTGPCPRSAPFAALAADLPHRLVLAGLAGWERELAAAVAASGVADRILVPGYVPESDKAALLTGADVFAYPSRYEGFGLPVLEALACGTPVVTTTGGSRCPRSCRRRRHPDRARRRHRPGRRHHQAGHRPGRRADAAARGLARAATYTWERCAELTTAAYSRALGGPTQPSSAQPRGDSR